MTHEIALQPSGKRFRAADGQTVLDAALEAGVRLPFGCRSGGCGACRARIRQGQVRYAAAPAALSAAAREQGEALLCQALPESDLVIAAEEMPSGTTLRVTNTDARVNARQQLNHDVMALYLKLPKRQRLHFLAGQYVDVLLRNGRRRSFSIASPEHADDTLELHLRQVPDGYFTRYVFEEMADKAILRLEGPLGNFYLRGDSFRPILMIAGGTGFAPIKSMIATALADTESATLNRTIHLYWGARSREDLYEHELIQRWAGEHAGLRYTPVLSESPQETGWRGGWVHEAVIQDYPDLSGFDIYMSGPPPMVDAARQAFPDHGAQTERFYSDSFDYAFVTWPSRG